MSGSSVEYVCGKDLFEDCLISFLFPFQPSENDQLKFDSHVLLHDMVSQVAEHTLGFFFRKQHLTTIQFMYMDLFSCLYHIPLYCFQEILHWKLLFTWSPAEGVKVLQMEQLPYHNHQPPQSANWTTDVLNTATAARCSHHLSSYCKKTNMFAGTVQDVIQGYTVLRCF